MSLVTITINNKNFQLSCSEGSERELSMLVDILNGKINDIKNTSPNASFELTLVMTALSLQSELQTLKSRIFDEESSKINKDDEKFSETLSTIAGYLENLAQKLNRYK